MNASLASIRAVGFHHLRRARELAAPRPIGRPRAGETRPAAVHDRAFERRRALRLARHYFTAAARLVNVRREAAERFGAIRPERAVCVGA